MTRLTRKRFGQVGSRDAGHSNRQMAPRQGAATLSERLPIVRWSAFNGAAEATRSRAVVPYKVFKYSNSARLLASGRLVP